MTMFTGRVQVTLGMLAVKAALEISLHCSRRDSKEHLDLWIEE